MSARTRARPRSSAYRKGTIPTERKRITRKRRKKKGIFHHQSSYRKHEENGHLLTFMKIKLNWREENFFFSFLSDIYIYIHDSIPVQWVWESNSSLLEIYNRHKKKNSRQKQIVQPTRNERKEKKRKKNVIAQQRSSHFFLIFPFSCSSHCIARVYIWVGVCVRVHSAVVWTKKKIPWRDRVMNVQHNCIDLKEKRKRWIQMRMWMNGICVCVYKQDRWVQKLVNCKSLWWSLK